MKKKILSLILSLALTFNMAGITAFAQGESVPPAAGETICTCTPAIGVSDVGHTNGCPSYPKSAPMARSANNYGSIKMTNTLVVSLGTSTPDCTDPNGMKHVHDSNKNPCWVWNLTTQELGLSNIDINIAGDGNGIQLECNGKIQLRDNTVNEITVLGENGRAIYAGDDLTIYGGGTLNARLTGSNANSPCIFAGNNIDIQKGNVTAVSTGEAAIECGTDGNIVISGGTVTATSSGSVAAIACGNGNSTIQLNGGKVTAKAAVGVKPFSEEPIISGGNMKLQAGSASWDNLNGKTCTYEEVELSSIEVTTPPTKTTYKTGESFDKTGMVITAVYSDGSKYVVTNYAVYPGGALAANDSNVRVSYTDNRVTTNAVTTTADVAITLVATPNNGGGTGGDSSDNDEYAFWMSVREKIEAAQNGDILKADAKASEKMPESVMAALRKNTGVSLVITWNGGKTITIPAGKAAKQEQGGIYYPLSRLAELYASYTEDSVLKSTAPQNPQTGGPGMLMPAAGGELITLEAPTPALTENAQANTITPPDAGFEASAFASTPDESAAQGTSPIAVAALVLLLAALGGGWVLLRKRDSKEQE